MSVIGIVASPREAALAGHDGELPGGAGSARTAASRDELAAAGDVGLQDLTPGGLVGVARELSQRPAADRLFDLGPGSGTLVVGAHAQAVADDLRGRGADAAAGELTLEDLARADTVVLLGEPGRPLAWEAPQVLAAGRVLVCPRPERTLGLLPQIDCLFHESAAEAAQWADAVASSPRAFDAMRVMARLAGRRHRASDVYARLLIDLQLTGGSPDAARTPRSG